MSARELWMKRTAEARRSGTWPLLHERWSGAGKWSASVQVAAIVPTHAG
jgi:hypothetical protein